MIRIGIVGIGFVGMKALWLVPLVGIFLWTVAPAKDLGQPQPETTFWASNDKPTLDVAVSVQKKKPTVHLWKDGKEDAPLDQKSSSWMVIQILGGDGKPAKEVPVKDGYFEMALPQAFFEANPQSITLTWIDFYRQ
jgi:hypothetical protein